MADYQTLIVEQEDGYALVRLNRPEALNALNSTLLGELSAYLDSVEHDDNVRCIVLTGTERAFAAGADIKEMASKTYAEMFTENFFA
ncbi:MAG TPA: enoyl-CoA hydratase-related protein, partial [Caulobacteraceae bacterium]|nr:enoyl-CoA hydratase-related protein [Caulobacteraceae bacterium]